MKDKFPFTKMNNTLQRVGVSNNMSFLGSVSGYNQVITLPINQHKATFKAPWGTYMFDHMPSRLKSAKATFQRAMAPDLSYFTMIYIDDIIVCFKTNKE